MTVEDYIEKRLDNQINWYDKKSKINKSRYRILKLLVIIFSVMIPFLAGLISDAHSWIKIAVGIGGVMIALFEGILTLYKYQENWLEYRNTAESLRREKIMFLTKAGPYSKDQSLQNLVQRSESIMSEENQDWTKNQVSETEDEKN